MSNLYDDESRSTDVEVIRIQGGWLTLADGYFCMIKRDGICVEDFGTTRRSALRYARRAWKKEHNKIVQKDLGYPKILRCEDGTNSK